MSTTTTKTIGTSSRDYSTLQAWEDACPANLTTSISGGEIWRGECYNDSEFVYTTSSSTVLNVSGITTDSTGYLELTTASGQSFADHADKLTNPLAYDATKGVAVRCTGGYSSLMESLSARIDITKIQFKKEAGSSNGSYGIVAQVGNGLLRDLIIDTADSSDSRATLYTGGSVVNIVMLVRAESASPGNITIGNFTSTGKAINNTIIKDTDKAASGKGLKIRYCTNPVVINNAVFGPYTTHFSEETTPHGSSGYNATNGSTAIGSSNQTSLTTANQVTGTTAATFDARVKTGSSLVNGTPQETDAPSDIVGTDRNGTTPTIGAWEFASAAVTSFLVRRVRQLYQLVR